MTIDPALQEKLLEAVINDNKDLISLYLDNGADINGSFKGKIALIIPILDSNYSLVKWLIEEKNANVNNTEHTLDLIDVGGTLKCIPLSCAIQQEDNFEIVKLLVENGADVNLESGLYCPCHGDQAFSPLTEAILTKYRKLEIVKFLVESGADVNWKSSNPKAYFKKPLEVALDHEDSDTMLEIIEYLKSKGATC